DDRGRIKPRAVRRVLQREMDALKSDVNRLQTELRNGRATAERSISDRIAEFDQGVWSLISELNGIKQQSLAELEALDAPGDPLEMLGTSELDRATAMAPLVADEFRRLDVVALRARADRVAAMADPSTVAVWLREARLAAQTATGASRDLYQESVGLMEGRAVKESKQRLLRRAELESQGEAADQLRGHVLKTTKIRDRMEAQYV